MGISLNPACLLAVKYFTVTCLVIIWKVIIVNLDILYQHLHGKAEETIKTTQTAGNLVEI